MDRDHGTRGESPISGALRAIPARLFAATDIAPLVAFRMAFGGLMFVEMLRFFTEGWIGPLYVEPAFHFTYPGFTWVRALPGDGMVFVFAGLAACALLIALGAYYRLAAIGFCAGFTYIFLVEAARYQNHFYLICLLSFLMIFVPAHRAASVDAWVHPEIRAAWVPAWPLWLLRGQVAALVLFVPGRWLRGVGGAMAEIRAEGGEGAKPMHPRLILTCLAAYFAIQILVPLRHHAYPGSASWTGEGDLFAWRMMLDRRVGELRFTVEDPASGRRWVVDPRDELADWQVEVLAMRPAFALQYAHHLRDWQRRESGAAVRIFAEHALSLNGRRAQAAIDPAVDLAALSRFAAAEDWLLPLDDGDRAVTGQQ